MLCVLCAIVYFVFGAFVFVGGVVVCSVCVVWCVGVLFLCCLCVEVVNWCYIWMQYLYL